MLHSQTESAHTLNKTTVRNLDSVLERSRSDKFPPTDANEGILFQSCYCRKYRFVVNVYSSCSLKDSDNWSGQCASHDSPPANTSVRSSAHHCSRPTWICNTYINTALSRVQRRTVGEGSTVIAPKHQPLISLKTNWCSMLTSFTLISGIKKNTGCNAWREGWARGFGVGGGVEETIH